MQLLLYKVNSKQPTNYTHHQNDKINKCNNPFLN